MSKPRRSLTSKALTEVLAPMSQAERLWALLVVLRKIRRQQAKRQEQG